MTNGRGMLLASFLSLIGTAAAFAADPPLVEKYLHEGKLRDGERALRAALDRNPADDQVRFGLGAVQFLQTFEHFGASLYRYGMRTERLFLNPIPQVRELAPQNPDPEKISYRDFRGMLEKWVEDLNRAEATLAEIKDDKVKLPIHATRVKFDLFGLGKPVSAAFIFARVNELPPPDRNLSGDADLVVFDRGDVCWLRGYCHFLAAWGEFMLAHDGKELFECAGHLAFEDVDTPHHFLLEQRDRFDTGAFWGWNRQQWADVIASIHLTLRVPVTEPKRYQAAHGHLLKMMAMSKEMWSHYRAENDDDHEWIPNPRQSGVLRIPVSEEMVNTWLSTVEEVELVLQGRRLIPFWRGNQADRGVNLKKLVMNPPQNFDVFLWVQGTAATPYLEKGPLTRFADPNSWRRIDQSFGQFNFAGFAIWFN